MPTFVAEEKKNHKGKVIAREFVIEAAKFESQVLPHGFPKTLLFGYGGKVRLPNGRVDFVRSVPGPTVEHRFGIPSIVHYRNRILGRNPLPVDPTLDWANPNNFPEPEPPFRPFPPGYREAQEPVAHVTHTHGIEVLPEFDGTPDLWFTPNGIVGPEFQSRTYNIPNSNEPAPFWYHDHVFGTTRLDVYQGLAGYAFLRDPRGTFLDSPESPLPRGEFEVPLIIQDKSFRTDGTLFYPTVGDNPDVNPYWVLMFDGNVNVVNGRAWPNLNVQRRQYRLRILNAGNQRFYNFFFSNGMTFTHIGTDGGFREVPVEIPDILLGVTERADILVDFSQFAPGTKIQLLNNAQLSPPIGAFPDPETDGRVMQFTVVNSPVVPPNPLPAVLNDIPELVPNRPERVLIQNADTDDMGRIIQAQLDGQLFHDFTTELPTVGATEDWVFLNTTPLDHNKHIHLIQFQLIERVPFDGARYLADWLAANGDPPFDHPTIKLPYEPYLTGPPVVLEPEEADGPWKDTIRTPANEITRVRIRWAPTPLDVATTPPGTNFFPFDPTYGVGYIWHCHLLEHEDNEMMRPMTVVDIWRAGVRYGIGRLLNPGPVVNVVDFEGINYRSRVAHVSRAAQPPPTRFDLWERVNNQNGDWAIQTIYDVGHRAVFGGNVYRALRRHQAVPGTEPPASPTLWELVL